jgi:hypothetical protein
MPYLVRLFQRKNPAKTYRSSSPTARTRLQRRWMRGAPASRLFATAVFTRRTNLPDDYYGIARDGSQSAAES